MRILHFSKLDGGGATLYARALEEGLRDRDIESRLVHQQGIPESAATRAHARHHFLNRVLNRFYVEVQTDVFHRTNRFREYDLRPMLSACDIVHIHQATDWVGLGNLFADVPKETPIIISLHDLWPITGGCVIHNGCEQYRNDCGACPILKKPLNYFLPRRQLKAKARIYDRDNLAFVANSQWTFDQMQGAAALRDDQSISIIHPSVDTDCFFPANRLAARRKLDIAADAFVVCTGAASITDANKNIPAVFSAVAKLKSDRPIVILVFGHGTLPGPDGIDIRLLGSVEDHAILAEIYNSSDVFVSTSRMETYGMTLIEAMACGIPVIAYRTGAIPCVVEHEVTGMLAGLNDEECVTESIQQLHDDEPYRVQLGQRGCDTATERNSRNQLVAKHLELYRAMLRRSSPIIK
jgi:glycosyltransferase involved in cell wall biosynthesis